MTTGSVTFKLNEPTTMHNIDPAVVDAACAEYWHCTTYPGQYTWKEIVRQRDNRLSTIRRAMQAALSAAAEAQKEEIARMRGALEVIAHLEGMTLSAAQKIARNVLDSIGE